MPKYNQHLAGLGSAGEKRESPGLWKIAGSKGKLALDYKKKCPRDT